MNKKMKALICLLVATASISACSTSNKATTSPKEETSATSENTTEARDDEDSESTTSQDSQSEETSNTANETKADAGKAEEQWNYLTYLNGSAEIHGVDYVKAIVEKANQDGYSEEDLQGKAVKKIGSLSVIDPYTADSPKYTPIENKKLPHSTPKQYCPYYEKADQKVMDHFLELVNNAKDLDGRTSLQDKLTSWQAEGAYVIRYAKELEGNDMISYRAFFPDGQIITVTTNGLFDIVDEFRGYGDAEKKQEINQVSIQNGMYEVFNDNLDNPAEFKYIPWGKMHPMESGKLGDFEIEGSDPKEFMYTWAAKDYQERKSHIESLKEVHSVKLEEVSADLNSPNGIQPSFRSTDFRKLLEKLTGPITKGSLAFTHAQPYFNLIYNPEPGVYFESWSNRNTGFTGGKLPLWEGSNVADDKDLMMGENPQHLTPISFSLLSGVSGAGKKYLEQFNEDIKNHPEKFMWKIAFMGDPNKSQIRLGQVLGGTGQGVLVEIEDYRYQYNINGQINTNSSDATGFGAEALDFVDSDLDKKLREEGAYIFSENATFYPVQ